ncbi:D-inositol-3-phosphate glycosyltransferase [Candidatus Magnetaquicoccaceae bacterium FCR-1]|uniref:D-inositol-3-phosphate glycosyltransferase n=1 Tax=Candidatus Magnetaquiglobus chichijimensis TaxID=3141448 RepID=A0ABQ0C546_9PROT
MTGAALRHPPIPLVDGPFVRILTFSTLFPHAGHPVHGIFVAERLRHLVATGEIESRVVAPIPWFPITHPRLNPFVQFGTRAPAREAIHGIEVLHPRYFLPPKIGMTSAPLLLAAGAFATLRRLIANGFDFDLIDAHYFYPDGIAAWLLGRQLGKPVVITARGSDLNQIPAHFLPGWMIRRVAERADGLITVSAALKRVLIGMDIPDERVTVLRNGVDLERFSPVEREAARAALGWRGPTLLSVGHLIERKGHDRIIRALPELPGVHLAIAGSGALQETLRALAWELGVADRVQLLGEIPQGQLRRYYSAADALVLASSREGWANVLLEAMACGTRVAATRVWGAPEVVTAPEAGVLIEGLEPAAIAMSVRDLLARAADPEATRRHAETFSWEATTRGQLHLFRDILQGG